MLIGSSPGTRRDSNSFARLSNTSVMILGTVTDACNQYNIVNRFSLTDFRINKNVD